MATLTLSFSSNDVATPTSNTAAVVTYTAIAAQCHALTGIAWSYNGVPTGGNLQIQDGSAVVFSVDITAAGPGFFMFPNLGIHGSANTNLVLTLAAGGSGITGKVDGIGHFIVSA